MGHRLTIGVARELPEDGIVGCRRIALRERVLRHLFGEKRRLTILVPGDSVRSLSIEEEADSHDK